MTFANLPTAPRPVVAVGVLVVRDGKALLIRRAKPPAQGRWSIPGGRLKYGETIIEAAKREVGEECGIEIEPSVVALVLNRIGRSGDKIEYHYVIIDLLARWVSGEAVAGDDAAEVEWIRLDEIEDRPTSPGLAGYLRQMLSGGPVVVASDVVDASE